MSIFCKNIFSLKTRFLCPYLKKNIHSLKNTMLSYHFSQIFHEKPSPAMLIFVSKKVNSFKNKLYHRLKKSIGCTFFRFFTKNPCSHPHILSTERSLSEKDTHSLKNTMLSCLFSNFHEKPHPAIPIFGQKNVKFVKITLHSGFRKSMGCLFSTFHEKYQLSCSFFSKKRSFSKKYNTPMSIFFQKNVHSLKNTMLSCNLYKFYKKPLFSCQYVVKKRQLCQN